MNDLLERCPNIFRAVNNLHIFHIRRKIRLGFLNNLAHRAYRLHGVGVACELNAEGDTHLPVGF